MLLMKSPRQGFGLVEATITVCVIVAVVLVWLSVWKMNTTKQEQASQNVQLQSDESTAKPTGGQSPENNKEPVVASESGDTEINADTPAPSTSPQPDSSPEQNIVRTTVTYRMGADGSTAQLAPVITGLDKQRSVDLIVDLQCLGECQFRLASDTHPLSSSAVYSSSQKITYRLDKPGQHFFYNSFNSSVKFGISF